MTAREDLLLSGARPPSLSEFAALKVPVAMPPWKWTGGKRQLLTQFEPLFPKTFTCYHEPFFGGGAVFWHLRPRLSPELITVSDSNNELMNALHSVRDDLPRLLTLLADHKNAHTEDSVLHYYTTRALDPNASPKTGPVMDRVEAAARFIYLNRTCFNGVYRVNKKGTFNVPIGSYANPTICDVENLTVCSHALKGVNIYARSYTEVEPRKGDFVYLDPPYVPLTKTADFTQYTKEGFGPKDQEKLRDTFARFTSSGVKCMLSNADTPVVWDLYKDKSWNITKVSATRAVNSVAAKRGKIGEVVVRNYV